MKKKTLLVADDELLIRWSIGEAFKDHYTVLSAASVDEALAQLERQPVDVLITDLKMPGRSGMELVEYARGHQPDAKVFVITAYGSDETLERCYTLDVDGYIRKPFELRMIRDMVDLHVAWPRAI
jgi:CheY-like chemotaxis protein